MFKLFTNIDNTNYPVKEYPRMDYIKRRYITILNYVLNYYHSNDKSVLNNHLFSKIISMLYDNYKTDPMELYRRLNNSRDYISRQFGLVSNASFGKIHNNILYKNNSKEIFISTDTFIDPYDFPTNWMDFTPVRIVFGEELNIDFYPFDGTKEKQFKSLSVFEVDIVILVMMYNYWSLERIQKDMSTNINIFVKTIVLPKIIPSCLDLTIWNRYMNIFYNNISNTGYTYRHPFPIIDMTNDVDNILRNIINDTNNKTMLYNNILAYVPGIISKNAQSTLHINLDYWTKQSEWSVWLSRIKYIEFLIDIGGSKGKDRNRLDINKLPEYIRLLENGSTPINTMLDDDLKRDFYNSIEKINNLLGKR